jgi:hypothetical protein
LPCATIALWCAAGAAPPPASQPAVGRDIEQAVRDLGDERFEVRERASELLFRAGPGAVTEALGEAAARGSPEARTRAETILGRFSRGAFPDTPVEIAALGEQYAMAADDEQQRLNIVTDLAGRGPYGCVVLLKLAEQEPVAELREMMARFVMSNARQAPAVASILLSGGDEATAERLLEQTAADSGGDDTPIRAYAALLLHEGKLDAKLRQLQAQVDRGGEVEAIRQGRTLAYFYRAAGDLERAAAAAEKALDLPTAETLALERRDWKRLAVILARRSPSGEREALRQLGFLAAAQRLAGDEAACDRTLEMVRDIALRDGTSGWPGATVLLLNERVEGAIDLLLKRGADFPYAFDLQMYMGRFEEALGLLERARAQRPAEAPWLAAMAARLQWRLGRRDAAMALLNEVEAGAKEAGGADSTRGFNIYVELVAAEREIGRAEPKVAERALRDATIALEGAAASENTSRLFHALYPRQGAAAAAAPWWDVACAAAGAGAVGGSGSKAEALATMERLMNRRLSGEQWTALVQAANETAGHALDAIHRSRRFGLVIDTLEAAGQAELADREFDKLAELFTWAKNLPREAYLYAAEWYGRHGGQWARAAELYAACADKYGAIPDLVWLRGYALAQAGQRERGERLMRQAPQLPLADERRMSLLADAMAAHGHADDAIAVRRMALRLGKPRGWTYYDECRTLSDALVRRGGGAQDIAEAADLCQLYSLEALDLNGTSVDDVHLPRMVHQLRARALCREGKVPEAMAELRAYLAIAPMDIDAALEGVPELKKIGRADAEAAARELFDISSKRLEASWAQYPESGFLHNEAAWLAVRCGYEPEGALAHARRAVELLPRDTASLDTLAEVLYRRGDRAGAVALMKRCEELEPGEAQHRQRREEFEKGKLVE